MLSDMQQIQAARRMKHPAWTTAFQSEWFLGLSLGTCVVFFFAGDALFAHLRNPFFWTIIFLWLFSAILGSALCVVRHAEGLAERLGEPYGTLILTLSVTSIEVMSITAVMLHGDNNPTLARDTMFAVVMIVLNGMVGLSLLLGALRHREQHYNLQGANIYLSVIIPLAVMAMILPDYTKTTAGPTLSATQQGFLVFASISLYCAFLAVQTGRHKGYFAIEGEAVAPEHHGKPQPNILFHSILLLAYMLPVVFLAEQLAHPVDHVIETLRMPAAIGGIIIAVIVATPEAIGAVHAARVNHMQRSVNIFLGSVLSTIGLTVPGIIIVSRITGHEIILGVQNADFMMLILTLAVAVVTFASGRTNVLQGAVHLLLFATYCLLIFQN
jgi:Ca2+:H+ antiporter